MVTAFFGIVAMTKTSDQDVISTDMLARAYEHDRKKREYRDSIVLSAEDAKIYFTPAMSEDDRRVLREFLVFTGKATWVIPR